MFCVQKVISVGINLHLYFTLHMPSSSRLKLRNHFATFANATSLQGLNYYYIC